MSSTSEANNIVSTDADAMFSYSGRLMAAHMTGAPLSVGGPGDVIGGSEEPPGEPS